MKPFDVDIDEMEDLLVVAPLFEDMRSRFAAAPMPAVNDDLASLFAFGTAPLTVEQLIGPIAPEQPARRRRSLLRPGAHARRGGIRRVAGIAVGCLALVGGMGAAGALPGAIQGPVASVARSVGINLPAPHHHSADENGSTTNGGTDRRSSVSGDGHDHTTTHSPTVDGSTTDGTSNSTATDQSSGSTSATNTKSSGDRSGGSTTGNSVVVSRSGSAVSSTSSGGSGGSDGSNGDRRPYHGNGRTTRPDNPHARPGDTTTTTADPSSSGTASPSTPPTTTAPTSATPSSSPTSGGPTPS